MSILERALGLINTGAPLEAEALAVAAVHEAADQHGEYTQAHAAACFELASVLAAVGDVHRGIEAMRMASELVSIDDDAERDRLTYQMNLGEFLRKAERLDEAEEVLRDSLEGRRVLYGDDHPGYAFGLEPLADCLLAQGLARDAAPLVEEALAINWRHGHPRVAPVLALRASIIKAGWHPRSPSLDHLDSLPEGLFESTALDCLNRSDSDPPEASLEVLRELEPQVAQRAPHLIGPLLVALSNVAQRIPDTPLRIEALERLLTVTDLDPYERVDTLMGLALAHAEEGQTDAVLESYREAELAATRLKDRGLLSAVRRNFGTYAHDAGDPKLAEQLLTDAVDDAREADAPGALGRALSVLGIWRQHVRQPLEAHSALTECLELLPMGHHDALRAASHLTAIQAGGGCGCDNLDDALSAALKAMVKLHLPADLLDDITVVTLPDGPDVRVRLSRAPSDPERELLDRVVSQSVRQLQQQARVQSYRSP